MLGLRSNPVIKIFNFVVTFSLSHSKAEMTDKMNPKLLNQIQYCERETIPIMVVIREEEKTQGLVKIRDVKTQERGKLMSSILSMFIIIFHY